MVVGCWSLLVVHCWLDAEGGGPRLDEQVVNKWLDAEGGGFRAV